MKRILHEALLKSKKSILLLGPRQVGKSTLIQSLAPDMTINLADQSEYLTFQTNTNELKERLQLFKPKTVFVDEIQRIPELLNTIQTVIDSTANIKFYLSGSSARKLKRGQANLLPGRVFTYRLGPLSCLEFSNDEFNSDIAMELGSLPEPYLMSNRTSSEKLLTSYAGTYLEEEIRAETMVRELSGFSRFLEIAASNSGLLLDFSKMASKAKVGRSAARRYFEILEDTLICQRIDPFEHSGVNDLKLVKHSKYVFFDIGVVNGLLHNFKSSLDRRGRLFENLFANQLFNASYVLDRHIKIQHFRTHDSKEVDFVVTLGDQIFLIETKSSEPEKSELNGLLFLKEKLQKSGVSCQAMVACLKCSPKIKENIAILPWQDVIKKIYKIS